MSFSAVELIETKRDGGALSPEAIRWLITAYTDGTVPDYQMAAMAMAIYLNGMDDEELAAWTEAMLHSGEVMDFADLPEPKVDKHSTGGVGDKISIPLAPLVAACGIAIPMISGRGLGHTGGTLDKLESIPGFNTQLAPQRFQEILHETGLVMAGASETIVPADRKLYALRDVTATVPSIPLIASSIMSKKLAEGIDGLVLDVKTGSGAFGRDPYVARALARTMVGIGTRHGVETVAFITSMEQPLGREVGNASEIRESIQVLRGEGPADITELTLTLGEAMLELGGIDGGREKLLETLDSGAALEKFIEIVKAHGGDPEAITDPSRLPHAPHEAVVAAPASGYVARCDALTIGIAATHLGAGRKRKEDTIDPGVGITLHSKIGDRVEPGDPLATVRYSDPARWEEQREALSRAWEIVAAPTTPPKLVLERIDTATI